MRSYPGSLAGVDNLKLPTAHAPYMAYTLIVKVDPGLQRQLNTSRTGGEHPMERQRATAAEPRRAYLPPEMELLRAVATAVLNEHINDADLCAICGSTWPCERVLLADHNLAVL